MGSGIAQVAARSGYAVFLRDIKEEFVAAGIRNIAQNLTRLTDKGKLDAGAGKDILGRITGMVDLSAARDADFVIEAALENMDLKKTLFRELDETLQPEAILATNTSSLSITEVGNATRRPDKVIGMHFFNPAPVMALVEVIRGALTSDAAYDATMELSRAFGKTPVTVNEAPGFVVNRVLIPMINEAVFMLTEGVASAEDIDSAMKLGANHPMGPLALGDLIGLDICLAIMETLNRETGDPKYRPAPLLRKMVRGGLLGRKTKQGFFHY
jgi:3-hydroxybutyryl-CoA dehydrogenase